MAHTRDMTHSLAPLTVTDAHRAATKDRLGGSRVSGIVRAWHALDPRCVTCLTVTTYDGAPGDRPTFGHLTPASVITPGATGGKRGGYTPDNGALMCADCQHAVGDTTVSTIHFLPAYFGTFPATRREYRVEASDKGSARALIGL